MIVGVLPSGARRPGKRSVFLIIIPTSEEKRKGEKVVFMREDQIATSLRSSQ